MVDVLAPLAYWTNDSLKDTPRTNKHILEEDQFIRVFEFIGDHLRQKLLDGHLPASSEENLLDVFFYLSSIFAWRLLSWKTSQETLENKDNKFGQALRSLLSALHATWTFGRRNDLIEARFKLADLGDDGFSAIWWHQLFKYFIDLRTVKQGVNVPFFIRIMGLNVA